MMAYEDYDTRSRASHAIALAGEFLRSDFRDKFRYTVRAGVGTWECTDGKTYIAIDDDVMFGFVAPYVYAFSGPDSADVDDIKTVEAAVKILKAKLLDWLP